MAKVSEKLSLPKVEEVHGVEIKKMPCGKYFEAIELLKEMPTSFIEELEKEFKKDNEDFKLSSLMTKDNFMILVSKMLSVIPNFAIKMLAKLLDIKETKIRNELTPKELADIIKKFWEINELESFFDQTKSATAKIMTLVGFKK